MKQYKFSRLEYTPTNYKALQDQIYEYTAQICTASSAEAVFNIMEAYDRMMNQAQMPLHIAYIRSYQDCTDSIYTEAVRAESAGASTLETAPYNQALLESPFFPQLEEKYGPQLRPCIETEYRLFTAGHELIARENALKEEYMQKRAMLKVRFRGAEYSLAELPQLINGPDRQTRIDAMKARNKAILARKDEFVLMFRELVDLRDKIAKANGFPNYLEYMNAYYGRRGYGEAEMTAFCQQVKDELGPLLKEMQEEQRAALGLDKLMSYDIGLRFADGNAVPAGDAAYLTEQAKAMYDTFSPTLGAFFRNMLETESLDVSASSKKVSGMGFCTVLAKGYYPFVFGNSNGTLEDVTTFTHEMGHAWQSYLTSAAVDLSVLAEMPLDAVEIPSKTMELFAYPYAEKFFDAEADKFRYGHFRGALREIAVFCAAHELNTWIYTHVDASFEELVAVENKINCQYSLYLDGGELEFYRKQGASLLLNLGMYYFPRYLISYALSQICAMELFRRSQTDFAAAWESYEKLCSCGGSLSYPEILAQAGLEPAYKPGTVRKVVSFARKYMETGHSGIK